MKRRPHRPVLAADRIDVVRRAFEPRYGHPLSDDDCLEIADNLRRFIEVLTEIAIEDGRLLDPEAREALHGA